MSLLLPVLLALGLAAWWWLLRGGVGRTPAAEWRAADFVFAGLLGAYFLLSILAGGRGNAPLTRADFEGGLVLYGILSAGLLASLAMRGLSPGRIFGLRPSSWSLAFGLAPLALAATYPVVMAAAHAATLLGHRTVSDGDPMIQFLLGSPSAGDLALIAVLVVVVAPFTEELVFRGFLYGVLRRPFGPMAAMATTALLFAAIHQNLPALPALFLLAVGLTLAYERTGSLWTPILMHALFNAISLVGTIYFPEWAL